MVRRLQPSAWKQIRMGGLSWVSITGWGRVKVGLDFQVRGYGWVRARLARAPRHIAPGAGQGGAIPSTLTASHEVGVCGGGAVAMPVSLAMCQSAYPAEPRGVQCPPWSHVPGCIQPPAV
eukprot:scaffold8866_cov96-Isochrysis_galbana.AAC.5